MDSAELYAAHTLTAVDKVGSVGVKTNNNIVSGLRAQFINLCLLLYLFFYTTWYLKNPVKAYKILLDFKVKRKKLHNYSWVKKYVKSHGRYFFSENIPGWPSRAFNMYLKGEILRATNNPDDIIALQTIILAITSRCRLSCSHCYEWDNLKARDCLSRDDLLNLIKRIWKLGVRHVQLSGGEPLERFDDLLYLLSATAKEINFWLITSGYGLTAEKANLLKNAGLTGAIISLDNWNENAHNKFRNNRNSFNWAKTAAANCNKAGMVTGLSLCATKSFISHENLEKYIILAKDWGAGFIRILEPMKTGNYSDSDVKLEYENWSILEDFYLKVNYSSKYRHYPIIMYPAYHQRRIGCFGAGNSYFYIDPKGNIHACPFCRQSAGNARNDSLIPAITLLKRMGCHEYKMNKTD